MDLEGPNPSRALADAGPPVGIQMANLRERVAQNPGNPAPRNKLAALLQSEGQQDEAASVLRETIGSFPKNAKAREQLRALLERPAALPVQEPAPRVERLFLSLDALPATQVAAPPEAGWSLTREPPDVPIRLTRWRPRAEWIASGSILLVVGLVWQVWRLLPESHLLQKPAVIVIEAAIAPVSGVVTASLTPPAAISIEARAADPAQMPPATVAAKAPTALPEAMPQVVMILHSQHGAGPLQAALRMQARLQAQHVPVLAPLAVAGAGHPGIGYFYVEDRPGAEILQHSMPDIQGAVRLISGAARAVQQPGAIAIVMP